MITEFRKFLDSPAASVSLRKLGRRFRNFESGLKAGMLGEHDIDLFLLSRGDNVEEAPIELQRLGVDRVWISTVGGLPFYQTVEYKTDFRAHQTSNLFLETQIRERNGEISPGWFRYCVAQKIIFYVPAIQRLLIADTQWLREWVLAYGKTLKHTAWVENDGGWAARGLLLPIERGKGETILRDVDMRNGECL